MKRNALKYERFIHVLFWIMIYIVLWLQAMPQTESLTESFLFPFLLIISIYPIVSYLSGTLLANTLKSKNFGNFIVQFVCLSIFTTIILYIYIKAFYLLEKKGVFPISEYFSWPNSVSGLLVLLSSGLLLNLIFCGLSFFLEYIKLQNITLEYQLQTLQKQLTPHFMFNVLNHIHVLMQTNVEMASGLLLKYSDMLRYQLYNIEKRSIKLEQDVQFLKDFIAVEETRWNENLLVSCKWKVEDGKKDIAPLLFIPFVENAFKHVPKTNTERGYINLNFEQKGNSIQLEIENSKSVLPKTKKKSSGLGLKNAEDRLNILYNNKYKVQITDRKTSYGIKLIINIQ